MLKEAPVTEFSLFLLIYSFSNDSFTFKNLCHGFFLFFVDFSRQLIFYHANEQLFSSQPFQLTNLISMNIMLWRISKMNARRKYVHFKSFLINETSALSKDMCILGFSKVPKISLVNEQHSIPRDESEFSTVFAHDNCLNYEYFDSLIPHTVFIVWKFVQVWLIFNRAITIKDDPLQVTL